MCWGIYEVNSDWGIRKTRRPHQPLRPSDSTGGNEIESLLFAGDGIPPPCIENNSKTPSLKLAGSVNLRASLFGGSMLGRGGVA